MSMEDELEKMWRHVKSEQKRGRLLTVSYSDVVGAVYLLERTRALLQPAASLPPKVGIFRRIAARVKKLILASASFTAGLFVGAAILLPIIAHASEYTGVGRDHTGEMVLVEFDETDKRGNLSGVMWRRLEVVEVDGTWCGKGLARFEGVKVEVVK